MFGLFGKKQEALSEDTVLIAGATAGIAFRRMEKSRGMFAVHETQAALDSCKQAACEMLSINPDERSRSVMHMVALTFAMDDSGLAERITSRYERGDKNILADEAQKLWDLTLKNANEVSAKLTKNGIR